MDFSKGKKGKKISIVFDTLPDKSYWEEIEESDILIHEASFMDSMKQRALQTKHSTAKEAAKTAEQTKCKKLFLFHISARHKDEQKIENEARQEFNDVTVAKDLMEVRI
jgi:ribonuclease Z